ncbi:NERD domain-containing protein [Kineococcus sp. NBC_00420]|uniref:nuclease-related domain-containing protein n=1 Tax=Kineococcus sp. NBC_00420 TaxID=2903564 RepID=UPI002E237F8A
MERLRRQPTTEDTTARLDAAERRHHAWSAGAEGERLVAETLGELEAEGWFVLHDVHWPGRPKANLDHVAVGPGGVVVIDAKNWSGQVTVRDGVLRNESWRKDRELEGIASAAAAVAALLEPAVRSTTQGLLCLVAQDQQPQATTSGVTVVGRAHLVAVVRGLERRLGADEVERIATFLRATLDGARSPVLVTTADVGTPTPAPHEPPARARRPVAARPRPIPRRTHRRPSWSRRLLLVLLTLAMAGLIGFLGMVVGLTVLQGMADSLVPPPAASSP